MWNFLKSPQLRISLCLSALTVSILLLSEIFGLVPDTKASEIKSRKIIAESLATQLSTAISGQHFKISEQALRSVVKRNPGILSGAVRMGDGKLRSEFGDHGKFWTSKLRDQSTPTQVQVPIFNDKGRWGTLELSFEALSEDLLVRNSFYSLILFVALAGFFANFLFLRQSLRELNPDAVIPERVRNAFNTLSEGILIIDKDGYIVFSNQAFSNKTGMTPEQLVGKVSGGLGWSSEHEATEMKVLPWYRALRGEKVPKSFRVQLKNPLKVTYNFNVSVSPITTAEDQIRGALVSFDDITEIELKNEELCRAIGKLENSQREISSQNKKLQVLATRDPLTDVLNRRSFFQGFESLFSQAKEDGEELSCVMVDIDHFKLVNDRFGHPEGDKVIKFLSRILTTASRANDLVGRIGGEEFCIVQPAVSCDGAASIAERMRQLIQEGGEGEFNSMLRITASFGVASLCNETTSHTEMLEQADKALYVAKESGRNRVIKWARTTDKGSHQVECCSSAEQQFAQGTVESSDELVDGFDDLSDSVQSESEQSIKLDSKVNELNSQKNELAPSTENSEKTSSEQYDDEEYFSSNNLLIIDRIGQALKRAPRYDNQIAVMIIDVDVMQHVSDPLGMTVNNHLSKTIMGRIKQVLQSTDTNLLREEELCFSIFLLAHKEVIVVLTDLKHSETVTTILQRILRLNNVSIEFEGNELFLNSSIGVSLYPDNGEDPDTLIRNANSAMLQAKHSICKNSFHFYDEHINQLSKKQIRLESELHHAIKRDELIVYYQPIVELKTGCILRMEALLRWQHPQFGLVPPEEFISLAEQTGLIEEISLWVIQSVCQQIILWEQAGYGRVNVAVNLSPVEFRDSDLADKIIQSVQNSGLSTNLIELEITESVAIQNVESTTGIIEKLSAAGFKIALDDFGTGYSSLSFIKLFPISVVKIDRSFVSDFMTNSMDAALVSAVIAMSHSLGLTVVAEGVETAEQLHFLQDLHCDTIQGFLISRPVSGENAGKLLLQPPWLPWMIKDYRTSGSGLTTGGSKGLETCMVGVLNNFPKKQIDSVIDHE